MIDKQTNHQELMNQIKALIAGEHDMIANMANISAVLFNGLTDINWAGFYIYKEDELVLGPFQGQPACIRIAMGKGVCGTAAKQGRMQNIANVHEFTGHIACDSRSNSEIVVPIFVGEQNSLIGVLDIDSPVFDRFNEQDQDFFQEVVEQLRKTIKPSTKN